MTPDHEQTLRDNTLEWLLNYNDHPDSLRIDVHASNKLTLSFMKDHRETPLSIIYAPPDCTLSQVVNVAHSFYEDGKVDSYSIRYFNQAK